MERANSIRNVEGCFWILVVALAQQRLVAGPEHLPNPVSCFKPTTYTWNAFSRKLFASALLLELNFDLWLVYMVSWVFGERITECRTRLSPAAPTPDIGIGRALG